MLDQQSLPGAGALGTSSHAYSLAPPHPWEAAPSTQRRVSVGYVGRKTRKGPPARKPLASCPPGPPDWAQPQLAGQLSSSLPGAQSMALLCTGVASAAGPGTSLQPTPRPRLGSDLGGLPSAAAPSRQLARRPAPAAPTSPGPVGSVSPVWPFSPGSPRWPGRGSFESLPAAAQGLAHSVRAQAPGRLR